MRLEMIFGRHIFLDAIDVVFDRGRIELESVKGSMNRRRDDALSCTCAVNGYKIGANELTCF